MCHVSGVLIKLEHLEKVMQTQRAHRKAQGDVSHWIKSWGTCPPHQLLKKVASETHFIFCNYGETGWCWSHLPHFQVFACMESLYEAELAGKITHQQTLYPIVLPWFMYLLSFKQHWFCSWNSAGSTVEQHNLYASADSQYILRCPTFFKLAN